MSVPRFTAEVALERPHYPYRNAALSSAIALLVTPQAPCAPGWFSCNCPDAPSICCPNGKSCMCFLGFGSCV